MKITHKNFIMFLGSFVINYFFIPPVLVSNTSHITNNLGKGYITTIIAIFTLLLSVGIDNINDKTININLYVMLGFFLVLFIYIYRNQIGIYKEQYLKGMIEHHSIGIFTSKEILKKTNDYKLTKLVKNIIYTLSHHMVLMEKLLNE